MRVLHLCATTKGGAFIAAQRLVESLNQTKEVSAEHLVFENDKKSMPYLTYWADNSIKEKITLLNHIFEKAFFFFYEKNKNVRFSFSLSNTGVDISNHPLFRKADLIHFHWINKGFLSFNGIKKIINNGKPIVWTMHDMWPFTGGCHYSGSCLRFTSRCGQCPFLRTQREQDLSTIIQGKKKLIFRSDNIQFVTPSDWLRKVAEKSAVLEGKEIKTIRNTIDLQKFSPAENKNELKKELGLNPDKLAVLFVAANIYDKRKGMRYLIEALGQIFKNSPEKAEKLQPVIVGKNSELFNMLYKFFPNTKNTGYLSSENIVKWYKASDLFVTPSQEDNLPNTVAEALACGVPVVGFRIGGIPEMVINNINGFLGEVESPGSIFNGINLFLESDRNFLSKNARAQAQNLFSGAKISAQYTDVYRRMSNK